MGRKHALLRKYNHKLKQKRAPPSLPPELKKALANAGVEAPKAKNAKDFYRSLGLRMDPNSDVRGKIGFQDRLGKLRIQQRELFPKKEEPVNTVPFVDVMESLPDAPKYQKHLNEFEFKCVAQLRAHYGDDYEMMAIDHRRNPMQWSIGELTKLMEVYEYEANLLREDRQNKEREEEEVLNS